jgi:3-isopropylmalate/(R)-2-methylmalate dehydratase small subunit
MEAACRHFPHEGRAWVFPEANINTDVLMPSSTFRLSREGQAAAVLSGVRPGWAEVVRAGDVLVAGRNFGTGSARPVPQLLLDLGIRCVVAESMSDLFFRNSINSGLPVMQCEGICAAVREHELLSVDVGTGSVVNRDTGAELRGPAMPPLLLDILVAGGLRAQLEEKGLVR